jgi:hypothetical protein
MKIKNKDMEKLGFAVGYVWARIFYEENHRKPTKEEIQKLNEKVEKYLLELLDK